LVENVFKQTEKVNVNREVCRKEGGKVAVKVQEK